MSVTEVHQGLGRWQLTLKDSTPRSVREAVGLVGHVHVTATRLDLAALTDPDDIYPSTTDYPAEDDLYPQMPLLQRTADYTGVVLHVGRGDDRTVSGYGLAWWMGGDQDGPIIEQPMSVDIGVAGALKHLLPPNLMPGTVHPTLESFKGVVEGMQTCRDALDYVLGHLGAEWRINPDGTVDAGDPAAMFAGETAVAVRDGGWDVDVDTLDVVSLAVDEDAEDWVSDVLLVGRGRDSDHVTGRATRPTPYRDVWGLEARRTALVSDTRSEEANADTDALVALHGRQQKRREVRLSSRDYHIDGRLRVGGTVSVYDPEAGLYSLPNEMVWRGRTIWPLDMRVLGITWPVTDAMGVYYVAGDGTRLDLTDYVETRGGDVTFTVGAKPRSLTNLDRMRHLMRQRFHGDALYIGGRL